MGYIWGNKATQQCNWLQFADDAAIVAHDTKSAQGLVNIFSAWCEWAHFKIRLDKCCVYGALKTKGKYIQILPTVSINNGHIPTVSVGEDFKYLGRFFNFDLNHDYVKKELIDKLTKLLKITNTLKVKTQTKLKIVAQYIPSQLTFELRIYPLPLAWISDNLDALTMRYVRHWLETPVSSWLK